MALTFKTLLSNPADIANFKVFGGSGTSNGGLIRDGAFKDASTDGNVEYAGIPFFHDLGNQSLIVSNRVNAPTMTINLPTATAIDKIHALAFTAYSNDMPNNAVVGHLRAYYDDDSYAQVDFITGLNISEWAYERPNTPYIMKHNEPMNLGYSWRTNIDSTEVYNGREYYVCLDLDALKLVTKIQLFVEADANIAINVSGLTMELPKAKSASLYVSNSRPSSPPLGFTMFDTFISKLIIFDGTDWRDTQGNIVV